MSAFYCLGHRFASNKFCPKKDRKVTQRRTFCSWTMRQETFRKETFIRTKKEEENQKI